MLKPVARGLSSSVVPELMRQNDHRQRLWQPVADVWSAANHLLQGKLVGASQMTLRVATNSILGLGGVLDPATEFGLERQSEDLGQTLGRWGMPPGPYLVLPLLGPSTLRDTAAMPVDRKPPRRSTPSMMPAPSPVSCRACNSSAPGPAC